MFVADSHFSNEKESYVSMNLTRKEKFSRCFIKSSIMIGVLKKSFPSLSSADNKSSFDDIVSCQLMKIDDEWQLHYQSD